VKLEVLVAGNRVAMVGRIDDSATFADVPARLPAGEVVIDTDGVTFINSIGMREWIRLLRALRETGRLVRLERVADVLITQMNLIAELKGVTISSFHAQYVCPACGAESAPVVDAVANAPLLSQLKVPALPCPECGAAMELGDFPERYLMIFKG
jgi:anti-anti-sigma regulatory factor